MEDEKRLLIKMLNSNKRQLESVRKSVTSIERIPKHAERAEEVRREGNVLFSKDDSNAETRVETFSHYCRSISLAPLNSEEMALAYGNRSALLLRLNKFQECIQDVDRAVEITKSSLLKAKLYCRKVECLKNLVSSDYKSALEKAEAYSNEVGQENYQSINELIDKVKACSITHNERNVDNKNIDTLPETDDFLDRIAIKRNEKYGRYLVAKKDYEPGDVIFTEKLFVTILNPKMNYTNCNYCLKICWSGIPCDYCSWAMFCSEDCKNKAWHAFHNVECSVTPFLRGSIPPNFLDCVNVSLRMLLVGIKEAGSINKLKEDLKMVDECTEGHSKGFYKNGKLSSNSIRSVYSLTSDGFTDSQREQIALMIGVVLVTLIEHSQLLTSSNLCKIEEFIKKQDLLFVGSFFMKMYPIKSNNCYSLSPRVCHCKRLKNRESHVNECCLKGSALAPVASLINHSCFANAGYLFTDDCQIVMYAEYPIKKDTQIFNTYVGRYFDTTLKDRHTRLQKYNFQCDCQACTELWPPLLSLSQSQLEGGNYAMKSNFEKKLFTDCMSIFRALNSNSFHFKRKDINILCKAIAQSKRLKQPSLLMSLLIKALDSVYSLIYGLKCSIYLFSQLKNA